METRIVTIDGTQTRDERKELLMQAGKILQDGGLVVFPTETVYGLGADAFNAEAARKIYEAKGRPSDNPLIVHIADPEALSDIAVFRDDAMRDMAMKLAGAFWPGPLTMVLPKRDHVPAETTGGLQTVAVRMPSHPIARALIRAGGGFVAAPSANRSGRPSPTSAAHCVEDLNGRVDWIIDGGPCVHGVESTVADCTEGTMPVILRPGVVTAAMIAQALNAPEAEMLPVTDLLENREVVHPKAPGMKYRHYAPKGRLRIVRGEAEKTVAYINREAGKLRKTGKKTGVLSSEELFSRYDADMVIAIGKRADSAAAAHGLYDALRQMDTESIDEIFSESFEEGDASEALMNRMYKASGGLVTSV